MQIEEFHQRAAVAGIEKMMSRAWFSICDLDEIAKLMNRSHMLGGKDYTALRALHTVNWGDMDPQLRAMTRAKILELLGASPAIVDVVQIKTVMPEPAPGNRLLRLVFGRK